jgi:hypothetical protein
VSGDRLEAWDPLTPTAVAELLESCSAPWWIAGGYAIDALVGPLGRRPHGDIDVGVLARDQGTIRAALRGWDLHCGDPPGDLRPWLGDEVLEEPIHDVWAREHSEGPWQLQLVLNPAEQDDWIYRRDPRVRRSLEQITWRSDGIPYLVAEVQLLFKSKAARPKDDRDLADSLPHLGDPQRTWLRRSLELSDPGNLWLAVI